MSYSKLNCPDCGKENGLESYGYEFDYGTDNEFLFSVIDQIYFYQCVNCEKDFKVKFDSTGKVFTITPKHEHYTVVVGKCPHCNHNITRKEYYNIKAE